MHRLLVMLILLVASNSYAAAACFELREQACNQGDRQSCIVRNNIRKLIDKCFEGHSDYCILLGSSYKKGEEGVGYYCPKDLEKSDEYYRKATEQFEEACDAGDGRGCVSLSVSYSYGRGVKQDHAKALQILEEACDIGHDKACQRIIRKR